MSSSSYRIVLERLSAQLDQLHSLFTSSASLPAPSARPPSFRFSTSSAPQSPQPNPAVFLASMGFKSEADVVDALDKYLEAIVDRRFPPQPPVAATAPARQNRPSSHRTKRPAAQSSSASSRAPAAANARTPKRPRPAAESARRPRPERGAPPPPPSSSLSKTYDKRNRTQKRRSTVPSPVVLKLRVRAPQEPDGADQAAPDRQTSQSSNRVRRRKLHASKPSSGRPHRRHSDDLSDSPDYPNARKKSRLSSKHKRRPTTSRHDDDDEHSYQERLPSTQEPSREPSPQRFSAREKSKLRSKKHHKRPHPSAANGSLAQRHNDAERFDAHRSERLDGRPRKMPSHKRRKVLSADESEREEPSSRKRSGHVETLSKRASPAVKHQATNADGDVQMGATGSKPQLEKESPFASLLAFAHKSGALSSVEKLDKSAIIKLRQSLATIPGCEQFEGFSLFRYCRGLCHFHKKALESMKTSYDGRVLKGKELDALSFDIDEKTWLDWIAGDSRESALCPPGLLKTSDAIQFVWRLLEVTAGTEDDVAETFMEKWYEEGLTTDIANLTLGAVQFWYNANRVNNENEENYSELLDWIIRLASSIVVYELSPSSFISKVNNLKPNSLFISKLHSSAHDSTSLRFDRFLSFSTEFVLACPSSLGKECRISVSELMQVFILRSGVPWNRGSPQYDAWKRISEQSQKIPETLCEQEFFWSCPFTKALQQVRREPLAADSCFDVGFLVNIVSSPLFMREVLQNQSKCLALLCDVMTKILEVMSRDLLPAFRIILDEEKNLPYVPTVLDFIQTLMSSAVMQRELLATDTKLKETFLTSINMVLIRTAPMGSNVRFHDKLEALANSGPLGTREMDSIVDKPLSSLPISEEKAMTRQRMLAFGAFLLASMGKSLEDGSRDMSQMNTLKAFLRSKAANTRNRKRIWEVVLRIQGGLEEHYFDCGVKKQVLSPEAHNHFTMVVEAIRKHILKCPVDYPKTPSSVDEKSSSSIDVILPRRRFPNISFPPVTSNPKLCRVASHQRGYFDLDEDPDILRLAQNVIKEDAEQMLARYDPETEYAWKWVRLQRKNSYIDGARDLLEKKDRALGQKCTCLPGNAKEKKDGSENRVACSNELCENRHLRIECVPGECGAGSYCQNQRLQRLEYAKFKMVNFQNKGVGLVADEDIRAGDLIGEYQGEVISMEKFRERMRQYQGERHFYFMTLTNKLVIDASRKSQATRFLNHSCDPNAETQKWNAGGEPRVGIYAVRDISKGEEITFDYGARSIEKGSAPCVCGAAKCRGTLTSKQEDIVQKASCSKDHGTDGISPEKPSEQEKSRGTDAEGSAQDVRKIVRSKIDLANENLRRASALGSLADEKAKSLKVSAEARWSSGAASRLKTWKETMARMKSSRAQMSLKEHDVDSSFRIPRRNTVNAGDGVDGQMFPKTEDKLGTRPGLSSDSRDHRGKSKNPSASTLSIPRVPRRSSIAADLRPKVPLSKLPGSTLLSQRPLQSYERKAELDRPLSRAALIGREQGFQPSSARLKRKPLKPKVKQRVKTRKTDSENDSMGEYSTASEAEPIMDEAPISPSQLPDGRGACSDDEFVPEPPLEQLLLQREDRKPADQVRSENARQVEPNGRRGEQFIADASRKAVTSGNPRGDHLQGCPERALRLPPVPRQDFDRSHFVGREDNRMRHPHGSSSMIDSSMLLATESRGPNADNERILPKEAMDKLPRHEGRESCDNRIGRSLWHKERPRRETEPQDRPLRLSHEAIRRKSPRPPNDRDFMRDFGPNRFERPRFSDGGRNENFQRHDRFGPRNRGYPHGYDEVHARRERQRWANAIREEPVRRRDSGKGVVPLARAPHDMPPNVREHHPRARHKEHFSRFAESEIAGNGRPLRRNVDQGLDGVHGARPVAKAPAGGELRAPDSAEKADRPQEALGGEHRERVAPRLSQTIAKGSAPPRRDAGLRPGAPVTGTLDSKAPVAKQGKVGAEVERKAIGVSEARIAATGGGSRKEGGLSSQDGRQCAPRLRAGAPSKEGAAAKLAAAKLEAPKSGRMLPVSEAGGVGASKSDEAKPHATAAQDVSGSREREEMRRSRFYEDDIRGGGNRSTAREQEASEVGGSKGRGRDSDGRAGGVAGKAMGPTHGGRGSMGGNAALGRHGARYSEARHGDEHDRRDRRKNSEGHGHEEGGLRRRSFDGHREDRKRARHKSPGRNSKRKRKSGRDAPRQSGSGDKAKDDGRKSQAVVSVVRGSTQTDLRSLLGKGRPAE